MPNKPPAPYLVTIGYVVAGYGHTLSLNAFSSEDFVAGGEPEDYELETRGDSDIKLDECVNTAWDLIRPLIPSNVTASTWDFWQTNALNSKKKFITGGVLDNQNGSNISAAALTYQMVLTWRSAAGGYGKIQIMEPSLQRVDQVPLLSTGVPAITALANYIKSSESWVIARDRSFLIQPLNASFGQNEEMNTIRNRP